MQDGNPTTDNIPRIPEFEKEKENISLTNIPRIPEFDKELELQSQFTPASLKTEKPLLPTPTIAEPEEESPYGMPEMNAEKTLQQGIQKPQTEKYKISEPVAYTKQLPTFEITAPKVDKPFDIPSLKTETEIKPKESIVQKQSHEDDDTIINIATGLWKTDPDAAVTLIQGLAGTKDYYKNYANQMGGANAINKKDYATAIKFYDAIPDEQKSGDDLYNSAYSKISIKDLSGALKQINYGLSLPTTEKNIEQKIKLKNLQGNLAYLSGNKELVDKISEEKNQLEYRRKQIESKQWLGLLTPLTPTEKDWQKQYEVLQKNILTAPVLSTAESMIEVYDGIKEMGENFTPETALLLYTKSPDLLKDKSFTGFTKALKGTAGTIFGMIPQIYLFQVGTGVLKETEQATTDTKVIENLEGTLFAPLSTTFEKIGILENMPESLKNITGLLDIATSMLVLHKSGKIVKKLNDVKGKYDAGKFQQRYNEEINKEVSDLKDDLSIIEKSQKNEPITTEDATKFTDAIEEAATDKDNPINLFKKQKELNLPTTPELFISKETQNILNKIDNNEPVLNTDLQKASSEIYNEYKRLEKIKEADTRLVTIEQINSSQWSLGEIVDKLENKINKQKETGEFDINKIPKQNLQKETTSMGEIKVEPIETKGKERKPYTVKISGDDKYNVFDEGGKQINTDGFEVKEDAIKFAEEHQKQVLEPAEEITTEEKPTEDYRMRHRIQEEENVTLDDLTGNGEFINNDFYTHPEKYFKITSPTYKESWEIIKKMKGKPDTEIIIYRTVPKGIDKINEGDWVTLSNTYAKQHGESNLNGEYEIISKKVKSKDIVWDGNDINEFSYHPKIVDKPIETNIKDETTGTNAPVSGLQAEGEQVNIGGNISDIESQAETPTKDTGTEQDQAAIEKSDQQLKDAGVSGRTAYTPLTNIVRRPDVFQYKGGGDVKGVNKNEVITGKYNPNLAGTIQVWRDVKNEVGGGENVIYLVDGHHRMDAMERNNIKDTDVFFIDAPTIADAKVEGAKANIAQGRGTSIDAAKVFKNATAEQLEGFEPPSKVGREGRELAKLNDEIFALIVDEKLSIDKGIAIAQVDKLKQNDFYNAIKKNEKSGAVKMNKQGLMTMAEKINSGDIASKKIGEETLFGRNEKEEIMLMEQSQLEADIKSKLLQDKKILEGANKNQEVLKKAGNIVAIEENQKLSEESRIASGLFDTYKNRKSVSDIIKDGTIKLSEAKGNKAKKIIREQIITDVKDAIQKELDNDFNKQKPTAKPVTTEPAKPEVTDLKKVVSDYLDSEYEKLIEDIEMYPRKNDFPRTKKRIKISDANSKLARTKDVLTANDAKAIIESAGLEVPKDILDLAAKEIAKPEQKITPEKPETELKKRDIKKEKLQDELRDLFGGLSNIQEIIGDKNKGDNIKNLGKIIYKSAELLEIKIEEGVEKAIEYLKSKLPNLKEFIDANKDDIIKESGVKFEKEPAKETAEEIQKNIHVVAANKFAKAIAEKELGSNEAVQELINSLPKGEKSMDILNNMLKNIDTEKLKKTRNDILDGKIDGVSDKIQAESSIDLALATAKKEKLRIKKQEAIDNNLSEAELNKIDKEMIEADKEFRDSFAANNMIGTQWGRFGQFRGALNKYVDKYNIVKMEKEYKASKNIKSDVELTEEQKKHIQEQHDLIKDAEAKLKEAQKIEDENKLLKEKEGESKIMIDKLNSIIEDYKKKKTGIKEKSETKIERLQKEKEGIKNTLKTLKYSRASALGILDPQLYSETAKLIDRNIKIAYETAKGKIELKQLLKETLKEINEVMPEFTEQDLVDAFTGNYKKVKKTKTELSEIKAELKKEAGIRNKYKDLFSENDKKIEDLENKIKKWKEKGKLSKTEEQRFKQIQKELDKLKDIREGNIPEIRKISKEDRPLLERLKKEQKKEIAGQKEKYKEGEWNKKKLKDTYKQIQYITDKINNKQYERPKIEVFEKSEDVLRAERLLEKRRKKWKDDRKYDYLKKRPLSFKIADTYNEIIRDFNLMFVSTLSKLGGVVSLAKISKIPRVLVQKGVSQLIPKKISKYADSFGDIKLGKSIKNYYVDTIKTFSTKTLERVFKEGQDFTNELSKETKSKILQYLGIGGKTHMLIKEFVKSPEYNFSLNNQTENAIKTYEEAYNKLQDKNITSKERKEYEDDLKYFDVSREDVMQRISNEALEYANWNILMNKNKWASKLKRGFGSKENLANKVLWQSQFQIASVPLNYVSRYIYNKYGSLLKALAGDWTKKQHTPGIFEVIGKRLFDKDAFDNIKMPIEVKKEFSKNIVNGSYRLMALGVAAMIYDNVEYDDKNKKFKIFGVEVSSKIMHYPLTDVILTDALTLKQIKEEGGDASLTDYLMASVKHDKKSLKGMPFYTQLTYGYLGNMIDAAEYILKGKPELATKEVEQGLGKLVSVFTAPPGFVREYAKEIDERLEKGEHLSPQGIGDMIKKDYPYLSLTVLTQKEAKIEKAKERHKELIEKAKEKKEKK